MGQLESEELRDLEASWRTAESTRARRDMILDLRQLVRLDEPTRTLLNRLKAAGATVLEGTCAPGNSADSLLRRSLAILTGKWRGSRQG